MSSVVYNFANSISMNPQQNIPDLTNLYYIVLNQISNNMFIGRGVAQTTQYICRGQKWLENIFGIQGILEQKIIIAWGGATVTDTGNYGTTYTPLGQEATIDGVPVDLMHLLTSFLSATWGGTVVQSNAGYNTPYSNPTPNVVAVTVHLNVGAEGTFRGAWKSCKENWSETLFT